MRIRTFLKSSTYFIVFFLAGLIAVGPYHVGNAQISEADKEALAKKGSLGWSPDLSDPAFYRGLSEEEANRAISFLKALTLSAMRVKSDPKATALLDKVDGFLRVGFRDTTRKQGWTEEEKLWLCLYQLEAESLGVFEFESKTEGKQLAKLWKEYKFDYKRENIDWLVMPLKGKSTYVGDPEYPGMNEVEVVQMKELKRRMDSLGISPATGVHRGLSDAEMDSLGISAGSKYVIKGIGNYGDPEVYRGLSDAEKFELIEFLKTISADTVRNPEGEKFKRRVMRFLDFSFADTSRNFSWTATEKQTMADFRREAEKLKLLEFNTEDKRLEAQKARSKK